jgi:two-component system, sporulation sensor kinase E
MKRLFNLTWLRSQTRTHTDISPAVLRDIFIVVASTAIISYFHLKPVHLGSVPQDTMHIVYRRLYYLPILYAAFRFGLRGGLITSLSITALFAPHAIRSMGGLFKGAAIDNFFDLVLYNVVAFTTGAVVEVKKRQTQRYQEVLQLNRDIEERENALRQMKAYTDSIISSVSSGVISVDRRGNVVTVNPEASRLLGSDEADLVGFPIKKIFINQEGLLSAARRILAGEQTRATMETDLSRDDKAQPTAVRITPHLSRGNPVGIVITIEDLSEVRDLTEQLMRADKLSGLGELVAGVAHEVRNPLGVIRASVQMMEQEMPEGCASAELTQVMIQEIDRLDSVVNALLDFGRPSESRFGRVNPQLVLDEVILLTRQFARQQRVTVSYENDESQPEVWADEDRLKQVFVNLISNAIQAMPEGGELDINAVTDGDLLKISFTDTGVGIPPEVRKRIFDPFYTTRADGSGLGLSIVHRIIDAHNGYINVASSEGKGTSFTVVLPLIKAGKQHEVELNA